MTKEPHVPEHWSKVDWEAKAKENPLHAIMTVEAFRDRTLEDLGERAPEEFLEKGRMIYRELVEKHLTAEERSRRLTMFDYGCGAGRIMRAVVDAGHESHGADIAPTMIEVCGRIVPEAASRIVVDSSGAVALADESCDVAYSFAVVQHIKSLIAHEKAIAEMARVIRPGGLLALQVNSEDYELAEGDRLGWTQNFEEFSVHFGPDFEKGPVRVHAQDNWSGVYIGADRLASQLHDLGFSITSVYNWNPKKKRAMVFICRKRKGASVMSPRKDPLSTATAAAFRALLKKYARVSIERSNLKKEVARLHAKASGDKRS